MISVIISSYQPEYFTALEKNIAETVGVRYEIIKVDNPGIMGICKAYNMGAQKAKYDNLLFIHEDILFHTQDWGEKLICHLQDPETGIIGVAGSDYVPVAPSSWYIHSPQHHFVHIMHNNKHSGTAIWNTMVNRRHKVFALDGVFLAIKAEKYNQFKFNERIHGFHGYDTEISLHVAKKYLNYAINDILIQHFSLGAADKFFFDVNIFIRELYGSDYHKSYDKKIEFERFNDFVSNMFKFNGFNFQSTRKTLKFIPWGKIQWRDYFEIIKLFLRFFKYQS